MKRIPIRRKKTIITARIAIPATAAAVFIPKAVKAAKRKKYAAL